jgi:polysaccharide biosynthesis/export protein VpsN
MRFVIAVFTAIMMVGFGTVFADEPIKDSYLSSYKLGAGDKISVRVFGEPDLSISGVTLTDSGSFMFPSVGEISALNKTLSEIESAISAKLKGKILVNPRVYVSVDEYRPFFIAGAVNKPGNIPFQPGLNISKAVAMAGGYTEKANVNQIFVDLPDGTKSHVEVNYTVKPGDNITIKEFEPIYVNGMVKSGGGSYPYPREGLNVRKAISLAGGFHERANVNKIYIIRNKDPKQTPTHVNLNDVVEPGDTITVEESFF